MVHIDSVPEQLKVSNFMFCPFPLSLAYLFWTVLLDSYAQPGTTWGTAEPIATSAATEVRNEAVLAARNVEGPTRAAVSVIDQT